MPFPYGNLCTVALLFIMFISLIDDDDISRMLLRAILRNSIGNIDLLGEAGSVDEGLKLIEKIPLTDTIIITAAQQYKVVKTKGVEKLIK